MLRKAQEKRKIPLREGLFAYFLIFCAVMLGLLFVLQMFFLDDFYYSVVKSRLEASAVAAIAITGEGENIADDIERLAVKNEVSIVIYNIDEGGKKIASARPEVGSVIGILGKTTLNNLYKYASESGGNRFFKYTAEGRGGIFAEPIEVGSIPDRLIYVSLADNADGEHIMVLLDCSITPMSTTITALKLQLGIILIVLIVLSVVLAYFASRRIASPIGEINESAKQLAMGKFDSDRKCEYREIEELRDTLTRAAEELSRVDSLQRELIANISHDLRTPLTMIIGYAEMMRDIDGENTPENMQVVIDEATKLSSLVNDVLEISKLQSGEVKPSLACFDLSELVITTAERYRTMTADRGFVFDVRANAAAPVYADRHRILRVLSNLVENAINYSGERREITVTLRVSDTSARVDVIDCGEGIASDELANIWQRYYRAGGNHKRSTVGSGLGLSIVRENLELHGARYGVDSTLGVGSDFWFELSLYKDGKL